MPSVVVVLALLGPAVLGDDYKLLVDGEEMETVVPTEVKGRVVLIPGDAVTQKLKLGIRWNKKFMWISDGKRVKQIKNDGGKKGGDVVQIKRRQIRKDGSEGKLMKVEIPRIPHHVLRDVFNIKVEEDRLAETVTISTKEKHNPFVEEEPLPELAMPGALVPDFSLPDLKTKKVVPISSFTGKRLVLVITASWDVSRDHLDWWQEFLDKSLLNEDEQEVLAVAAVAIEPERDERIQNFVERAGASFPVLIDRANAVSRVFGYKDVPVVVLIDELGVYQRLVSPRHPKEVESGIEKFLAEDFRPEFIAPREPKPALTRKDIVDLLSNNPNDVGARIEMAEIYRDAKQWDKAISQMESAARADEKNGEVHFRWGHYLWLQEKREEAIPEFRQGAKVAPTEWIVRKMIWAIEHPDRFYRGRIDLAWQQAQIAKGE